LKRPFLDLVKGEAIDKGRQVLYAQIRFRRGVLQELLQLASDDDQEALAVVED
jgi:hypothetical protein